MLEFVKGVILGVGGGAIAVKLVVDAFKWLYPSDMYPGLSGRKTQILVFALSLAAAYVTTGFADGQAYVIAVTAIFCGALGIDNVVRRDV